MIELTPIQREIIERNPETNLIIILDPRITPSSFLFSTILFTTIPSKPSEHAIVKKEIYEAA